jgi:hypothetical protein
MLSTELHSELACCIAVMLQIFGLVRASAHKFASGKNFVRMCVRIECISTVCILVVPVKQEACEMSIVYAVYAAHEPLLLAETCSSLVVVAVVAVSVCYRQKWPSDTTYCSFCKALLLVITYSQLPLPNSAS